ncbi:hypothetical protein RF11_08143 [Thelohanellus kitauei]|uniref:Uncharacterized protein n=1 Tax=Thelohanellus kitauei TaxID=669202 RepID=A0A0C2IS44_THEKT|nr:hypothetical protein RF11_08143 [Thelohanellus kitauei]
MQDQRQPTSLKARDIYSYYLLYSLKIWRDCNARYHANHSLPIATERLPNTSVLWYDRNYHHYHPAEMVLMHSIYMQQIIKYQHKNCSFYMIFLDEWFLFELFQFQVHPVLDQILDKGPLQRFRDSFAINVL